MIYIVNKATEADVLQHFGDIKSDGVGYERETPKVVWNRYSPPVYGAGTIVLSKDGELFYCGYEDYDAADWAGYVKEGVIVAPAGHFPDGKARMVPLSGVTSTAGTAGNYSSFRWGPNSDTSLVCYDKVPTWDNNGTYSAASTCYVPSNNGGSFSGTTYANDSTVKYYGSATSTLGLSPYLSDGSLDQHFRSGFTGTSLNAFSDINGYENTDTLYNLGYFYSAATACHNFTNGDNGGLFTAPGTWYLPALGELAYIMPRLLQINLALTAVGGLTLSTSMYWWSSTEGYYSTYAWLLGTSNGKPNSTQKNNGSSSVLPFAKV